MQMSTVLRFSSVQVTTCSLTVATTGFAGGGVGRGLGRKRCDRGDCAERDEQEAKLDHVTVPSGLAPFC